MKSFSRKPRFEGRDNSRSSSEEPRYEPRGDRPRRGPSRFGGGREGGSRFGGREERGEDRSSRFGGRRESARDKPLFRTVCDKCGEKCEVPFKPTEGKPVYCSDCFRKNEGANPRRSDSRRPDNNYQEQFDQINAKLDKIMRTMGIFGKPEEE